MITILGIFVAVASARLGWTPTRNFASQADAKRLAFDLLQARRRAIASGENHYVEFSSSGGLVAGYTMYRRVSGGGIEAVDAYRDFPHGETVTTTASQVEFNFEGAALAACEITFTGPDQTWKVSLVPATGTVKVVQL